MTVGEFDRYLAGIQKSRDGRAASLIAAVSLNERASLSDLARWQSEFKGERARQALVAVMDVAEFVPSSASAKPDVPAPPAAAQSEMISRTVSYVNETLHRLPNFFAVRTTTRFEISSQKQLEQMEEASRIYPTRTWIPNYVPLGTNSGKILFMEGAWRHAVAYRDGKETSQSQVGKNRNPMPPGLETMGEFGPILTTVVGDSLKGSIRWSHWEQDESGQLAVYSYTVPAGASHYAVQNTITGSAEFPAYHGEYAIDPGTGAIYRIAITAEGSEASSALESNILLEYGPVEIGGTAYICPLHGVAYTQPRLVDASGKSLPEQEQAKSVMRFLNDTTFTHYQLFRSEVRILTGDPPQ